jgi:hypothetical protein
MQATEKRGEARVGAWASSWRTPHGRRPIISYACMPAAGRTPALAPPRVCLACARPPTFPPPFPSPGLTHAALVRMEGDVERALGGGLGDPEYWDAVLKRLQVREKRAKALLLERVTCRGKVLIQCQG